LLWIIGAWSCSLSGFKPCCWVSHKLKTSLHKYCQQTCSPCSSNGCAYALGGWQLTPHKWYKLSFLEVEHSHHYYASLWSGLYLNLCNISLENAVFQIFLHIKAHTFFSIVMCLFLSQWRREGIVANGSTEPMKPSSLSCCTCTKSLHQLKASTLSIFFVNKVKGWRDWSMKQSIYTMQTWREKDAFKGKEKEGT